MIKKKYNIVAYTASHQSYADSVLDLLDPDKKYFKYRLYRNNCLSKVIDGNKIYIKDLDILKYDLKNVVIIDNSVLSFAYHLDHGIPIVPYYDRKNDRYLLIIAAYLSQIADKEDLREMNKKIYRLTEMKEKIKDEHVDQNLSNEEDQASGDVKSLKNCD